MTDSNKLVTMIALVIAGLLIAVWGGIYIWLHRNDELVIAELVRQGRITAVEAARRTNPTWIWVLSISQIIIGIILIAWGFFQYFLKVDDVVVVAGKGVDTVVRRACDSNLVTGVVNGVNSRRLYVENNL